MRFSEAFKSRRHRAHWLTFVFCLGVAGVAQSQDWSQFLGPQRNGISAEVGLLEQLPPDGPKIVWRVPGGVGMSGVAISGKHAITMWNTANGQVVASLNPENGETNWQTSLAAPYENSMGDGPRATPTISGERVFAYTGSGILACLKLSDGSRLWSKNVTADVGARPSEYGMSSSPLVVGDSVVVTCGGKGTAVVALAAADGKVRWSAGDGAAGYASPALLPVGSEQQIVAFTGSGVTGIDPVSGQLLWSYPFKTPYDCNTASPISVNGNVFISAGENHGCVMLKITKQNEQYEVTELWESTMTKSVMRNEWQTSIFLDGYLYGFDNVGSAGPTTHLTCIDAATGEPVWQKSRFGKGNLIAADGKLWITTMKGQLVMVAATPSGYNELGRADVLGKTRQAFAIQQGRAFIRDDREVVCIDLRK
jgi:outer membrane protein assembly factor BamB